LLAQEHDVELVHLSIPTTSDIDDVVALLAEKIIVSNAFLVGFSLGGYLASALTLRFPEKITRLLIVSNLPRNLPEQEIKQRKRTIAWIAQRGYSGIPTKRILDLIDPSARENLGIHQTIREMDKALGGNVLLHQLQVSMDRQCLLADLALINIPVSFLIGTSDRLVDLAVLDDFIECNDHIHLEKISGVGHMLPLECPSALARVICRWQ
jgi:pimeloyl-ACP methyl ester carboxylesterase